VAAVRRIWAADSAASAPLPAPAAERSRARAQVSALFHIASSKGPPPLPEQLSQAGRDFLLLCFKRRAARPGARRTARWRRQGQG